MGLTALDVFPTLGGSGRAIEFSERYPGFVLVGYEGVGMGLALFRWSPARAMSRLDPLMRWFVMDGYGFAYGLLRAREATVKARRPREFRDGTAARSFDIGLGRSFWFFECADVERIVARVASFAPERQGALWAGLGTACTHACGVSRSELEALTAAAGKHASALACGAALTAYIRQQAQNFEEHVRLGMDVIWQAPPEAVAGVFASAMARGREARNVEDTYPQMLAHIEAEHRSRTRASLQKHRGLT